MKKKENKGKLDHVQDGERIFGAMEYVYGELRKKIKWSEGES